MRLLVQTLREQARRKKTKLLSGSLLLLSTTQRLNTLKVENLELKSTHVTDGAKLKKLEALLELARANTEELDDKIFNEAPAVAALRYVKAKTKT